MTGLKRCTSIFSNAMLAALCLFLPAICAAQGGLNWPSLKNEIRAKFPSAQQLSTQALADWFAFADSTQPVVLDVREKKEFKVSHLKGARRARSKKNALKILQGLAKDHPIVAYCSVGYRSSELVEKLQQAGYTNVYNLEGSIFEWANENRPVYAGEKLVERVHPYNKKWGQLLEKKFWEKSHSRDKDRADR